MKTRIIAGFLVVGVMAGGAAASEGPALFRAKCQACHGVAGRGNPALKKVYGPNIDITGENTRLRTDEELRKIIGHGAVKGKMPAFKKKLTDAQIDDVIRQVRSLGVLPPTPISDLNDE